MKDMKPGLRKFVLTAHVTFAVSWLGAVAAFLVLAIAGLASQDEDLVRSAYLTMDLIARFVILPLSFAPLITGPILSVFTPWGLFRHYWILVKALITVLSTLILLVHLQPISVLAAAAAEGSLPRGELLGMQVQMVIASSVGLLALLLATGLGVYKPRGETPWAG